jgi:hypothetical protein
MHEYESQHVAAAPSFLQVQATASFPQEQGSGPQVAAAMHLVAELTTRLRGRQRLSHICFIHSHVIALRPQLASAKRRRSRH